MHIVTNRKRTLHKGTVLFLVLVLLFTGCSSVNDGYRDRDFSDFPPTLGADAMTLREYRSINFDDWVNWDAFISYDMLRGYFGDFHSFAFGDGNGNWDEEIRAILDTDGYRYRFVDKDRTKYIIDIDETSAQIEPYGIGDPRFAVITDVPNKNDLRTIEAPDMYLFVYYYVGDIIYSYNNSVLESISWNTGTHSFDLSVPSAFVELCDLESGSFLARLVREDTAEAAVAEFNAHIERCLSVRRFCRRHLPWILAIVAPTAAVVLIICLHRRIKNRKKRDKV